MAPKKDYTKYLLIISVFAANFIFMTCFAEEWGISSGGLHCRLELQKEIFNVGEPIELAFHIEPVEGLDKNIISEISCQKEGLVENLKIKGPDGDLLQLIRKPGFPPSGTFHTSIRVSGYYDFSRKGDYSIAAIYEVNDKIRIKSQTVFLTIVPKDFIVMSIETENKRCSPFGPIPISVLLSTGSREPVELEDVSIFFYMERIWSSPHRRSVPLGITLTNEEQEFTYDLSLDWDYRHSSVWPCKPLSDFVKAGERHDLVAIISGKYKGKRFEVESAPLPIKFTCITETNNTP